MISRTRGVSSVREEGKDYARFINSHAGTGFTPSDRADNLINKPIAESYIPSTEKSRQKRLDSFSSLPQRNVTKLLVGFS